MVFPIYEQIAIFLIVFSGYAIGQILANVALDEIKSGNVYFKLIRSVMLISIIFFLLFYLKFAMILILPAILVTLFTGVTLRKVTKVTEAFGYIILVLTLILTFYSNNSNLVFLIGSLIFVFLLSSVAVLRGQKMPRIPRKR